MDHRNRDKLIDVTERRTLAEPLECRESSDGQLVLTGYAATFEPYDCYGGPAGGGWVEEISRSAMDRTLGESPDVMLLINHEGLPIARTKSGNLTMRTDSHGLLIRAELDPSDPDVQRIAPKMKARRGNRPLLDEMSFSFRVKNHKWNTDRSHRVINELSLQKGDVSVVNYGMNPRTRAALAPEAVAALARSTDEELLEIRRMDRTAVGAAMQVLQRAWRANEEDERGDFGGKKAPPFGKGDDKDGDKDGKKDGDERAGTYVNFDGSHLMYDGLCVTCAHDRAKKPYGNVEYADPGYLGPDGKPAHDGNGQARYPIDAQHVMAAWSYINQPKNQKGYTAEQLSAIKGRIKAAMKKAGHDVSDDKKAQRAADDCTCPNDNCPVHDDASSGELYRVEAVRMANGGISMVAVTSDGTRTPLPSFRQSGQQVGSPGMAPFRPGVGGGPIPQRYARAITPNPDQGTAHTGPPINDSLDNSLTKVPGIPSNVEGGPQIDYDWKPGDANADPHLDAYTKSDEGTKDPGELHGTARATSSEPGGKLGGDDDKDDDEDDRADKKPADDTDDEDDTNERDFRSVEERLRELRRENDMPDLPSLDDAMTYIRQLA
jgi:HK97 family phage prohead protease